MAASFNRLLAITSLLLIQALVTACVGSSGSPEPTTSESSCSDAPRDPRKFTATAESEGKARREAILAEIKELPDHPWAGEYYFGDGLGVNVLITLAPTNGFTFSWHGCLGLYDQNWGEVVTDEKGALHLRCHFDNVQHGFQGIATDFQPVRWGKRHYLVPVNELIEFCNHVNSGAAGHQGPHGRFALRCGDEKEPVSGYPEVPTEYRRLLLSKPIAAKISAIAEGGQITVDIGTADGAFEGMEMFVDDPDYIVRWIKLTNVGADTSQATEVRTLLKDPPKLKAGLKLCTRAPWER